MIEKISKGFEMIHFVLFVICRYVICNSVRLKKNTILNIVEVRSSMFSFNDIKFVYL